MYFYHSRLPFFLPNPLRSPPAQLSTTCHLFGLVWFGFQQSEINTERYSWSPDYGEPGPHLINLQYNPYTQGSGNIVEKKKKAERIVRAKSPGHLLLVSFVKERDREH